MIDLVALHSLYCSNVDASNRELRDSVGKASFRSVLDASKASFHNTEESIHRTVGTDKHIGNFLLSPLKKSLEGFNQTVQGMMLGKLSTLEAATSLKQARLCLELMTEIRKHVVSGLNQILNNSSV